MKDNGCNQKWGNQVCSCGKMSENTDPYIRFEESWSKWNKDRTFPPRLPLSKTTKIQVKAAVIP
jgi:hypothetical protein